MGRAFGAAVQIVRGGAPPPPRAAHAHTWSPNPVYYTIQLTVWPAALTICGCAWLPLCRMEPAAASEATTHQPVK